MPSVSVAPQFLHAFLGLRRPIQRKTIAFVEKLQADPKSPGLNFKAIRGARDRKLRSARVDRDYRAIVVQPTRGEVYRVVWVDRHEEAYAWARDRLFKESLDGTQCQLIVENVSEVERCIEAQKGPGGEHGLFDAFTDEVLGSICVPAELILLLRQIRSADVLLSLRGIVAEHVVYALECLINGDDLRTVQDYVAAEATMLRSESVALLSAGRLESVSAQHGLREVLERLMSVGPLTVRSDSGNIPLRGERERIPSGSDEGAGASGSGGGGREGGAPSNDDGLEGRIELHRLALLAHIEDRFDGVEPIPLRALAERLEKQEREQRLRPRRSAMRAIRQQEGELVELLKERLEQSEAALVLSEGGGGKTTSLRQLARCWAETYVPEQRVRLIAFLGNFNSRHQDVIEFLTDKLAFPLGPCPELTKEDLLFLAGKRRLEVILDGADECPLGTTELLSKLDRFVCELKVPIVLGTRSPVACGDLFPWQLRIQPMTQELQERFAGRYLRDPVRGRQIVSGLYRTPGGVQIAASPICLSIICSMALDDPHWDGSVEGRARLYREFFTFLYDRESEKRRKDLFPSVEGDATRFALAKLFFNAFIARRTPTRDDAVEALKNIHSGQAADVVRILLEWPLFESEDRTKLAVRHQTYGEYFAAEHVLHSLSSPDCQSLFERLNWDQTFVLGCIFELADGSFYENGNNAARRLIEAAWHWDPLFVAAAIRNDHVLASLPFPADWDAWQRGLLRVLQGNATWRDLPETEEITERELSFPKPVLCARMIRADFWEWASAHELGERRLERLWKMLTRVPEPWADILEPCLEGNLGWRKRVQCLARRARSERTRARYKVLGFAVGALGRKTFSVRPVRWSRIERQASPVDVSDLVPGRNIIPPEWRRVPPRLLLYCLLKQVQIRRHAYCNPVFWTLPIHERLFLVSQLDIELERGRGVYRGKVATFVRFEPELSDLYRRRKVALGYLFWFFIQNPWYRSDERRFLSRRQWTYFWSIYDSEYYPAIVLDLSRSRSKAVLALNATAPPSCNVLALLTRWRCLDPEDVQGALSIPDNITFAEARALLFSEVVSVEQFPIQEHIVRWLENMETFSDTSELFRLRSTDRVRFDLLPAACVNRLIRILFDEVLVSPAQERVLRNLSISWGQLAVETRNGLLSDTRLVRYRVFVNDDWCNRYIAAVTTLLLNALGRGDLVWNDLLPVEIDWLQDPATAQAIRDTVIRGLMSLDLLSQAPPVIVQSNHVQSLMQEKSTLDELTESQLGALFGCTSFEINKELVGGQSGSRVVRVFYSLLGSAPSFGVLKITTKQEDFDREKSGHMAAKAKECWMNKRGWIPDEPVAKESPDRIYYLLSKLAFPPRVGSPDNPSLHSLVETGDSSRAEVVIDDLRDGYFRQFLAPGLTQSPSAHTAFDHVKKLLTKWTRVQGYWERDGAQKPEVLPRACEQTFQDLDHTCRWNPLWLVTHPEVWMGEARPLSICQVHGDLNARNVLVSPEAGTQRRLQLIDFEKFGEHLLAVDLCWLAFWLVMASSQSRQLSSRDRVALPRAIYSAINGSEQFPGFLGDFQLGLDLSRRLFAPWNQVPPELSDALPTLAHDTVGCALIAAATAKALLHDRDVFRPRDAPRRESAEWALTFYRLAALAADPYLVQELARPAQNIALSDTYTKIESW